MSDIQVRNNALARLMSFKGASVTDAAVYIFAVSPTHTFDTNSFLHRALISTVDNLTLNLPLIQPVSSASSFYYMYFDGAVDSTITFQPNAANAVNNGAFGDPYVVTSSGDVTCLVLFSYLDSWFIQPISFVNLIAGAGITITGTFPNFTISAELPQHFTFESDVVNQLFDAAAAPRLLGIPLTITSTDPGPDWILAPGDTAIQFKGTRAKIYQISVRVQQTDSGVVLFRPQIYMTRENVVITGNGAAIGTYSTTAGVTTDIDMYPTGAFITIQPDDFLYFSIINASTGALGGTSTDFVYTVFLAEAR